MSTPEPGKVYALTGLGRSVGRDRWQESEVFCVGIVADHGREGCNDLGHEHYSARFIRHTKHTAELLGCTPYKCGYPSHQ